MAVQSKRNCDCCGKIDDGSSQWYFIHAGPRLSVTTHDLCSLECMAKYAPKISDFANATLNADKAETKAAAKVSQEQKETAEAALTKTKASK
jgi:hypothetical protein